MLAATLWGLLSVFYMRRRNAVSTMNAGFQTIGGLRFDDSLNAFYDAGNEEIHFTPMQHELMRMFFRQAVEGRNLLRAVAGQA